MYLQEKVIYLKLTSLVLPLSSLMFLLRLILVCSYLYCS